MTWSAGASGTDRLRNGGTWTTIVGALLVSGCWQEIPYQQPATDSKPPQTATVDGTHPDRSPRTSRFSASRTLAVPPAAQPAPQPVPIDEFSD